MKQGKLDAEQRLFQLVQGRFRLLAHQMLRHYGKLKHVEDTDDVLQKTLLRLSQVLKSFCPESPQVFFSLSSKHMRWILIDLARTYAQEHHLRLYLSVEQNGLEHLAEHHAEPLSFDDWVQFHETVEALRDDEKDVVNLLFYQGLSQQEAADLLNVSLRTVKLRWQSAKLQLSRGVRGTTHEDRNAT